MMDPALQYSSIGIPVDEIDELAKNHCNTTPTMMPYITAFFMPRRKGDRPDVIPDGSRGDLPSISLTEASKRSLTSYTLPHTSGTPLATPRRPDGCVNFAFLGQFAETPRDTIFTTEYSVRTAMEAVYGLLA